MAKRAKIARVALRALIAVVCAICALSAAACGEERGESPVVKLTVSTTPRTTYFVGEAFDIGDAKLTVTYEDGRTETVSLTDSMISKFDSNAVGDQTLTVRYKNASQYLKVNVTQPAVRALEVASTEHKSEYIVGQKLDVTGLKIRVTYVNGRSEIVDVAEDMVRGFSTEKPGEFSIAIAHGNRVCNAAIRVIGRKIAQRQLIAPRKNVYVVGEELDLTGGELFVSYNDNSTERIDLATTDGVEARIVGNESYEPYEPRKFQEAKLNATVRVEYKAREFFGDYTVAVNAVAATKAIVTSEPDEQVLGAKPDFASGRMTVEYNDGKRRENVGFDDPDVRLGVEDCKLDRAGEFGEAGTHKLEINVGGLSFCVDIVVAAPKQIALAVVPNRTEIFQGQKFGILDWKYGIALDNGKMQTFDGVAARAVKEDMFLGEYVPPKGAATGNTEYFAYYKDYEKLDRAFEFAPPRFPKGYYLKNPTTGEYAPATRGYSKAKEYWVKGYVSQGVPKRGTALGDNAREIRKLSSDRAIEHGTRAFAFELEIPGGLRKLSGDVEISVTKKEIVSCEIANVGRDVFMAGDMFEFGGATIRPKYNDGTTKDIPAPLTASMLYSDPECETPLDLSEELQATEKKEIYVKYAESSETCESECVSSFAIAVARKAIALDWSGAPKKRYVLGERFEIEKCKAKITYGDNSYDEIDGSLGGFDGKEWTLTIRRRDPFGAMRECANFDVESPGEYEARISYASSVSLIAELRVTNDIASIAPKTPHLGFVAEGVEPVVEGVEIVETRENGDRSARRLLKSEIFLADGDDSRGSAPCRAPAFAPTRPIPAFCPAAAQADVDRFDWKNRSLPYAVRLDDGSFRRVGADEAYDQSLATRYYVDLAALHKSTWGENRAHFRVICDGNDQYSPAPGEYDPKLRYCVFNLHRVEIRPEGANAAPPAWAWLTSAPKRTTNVAAPSMREEYAAEEGGRGWDISELRIRLEFDNGTEAFASGEPRGSEFKIEPIENPSAEEAWAFEFVANGLARKVAFLDENGAKADCFEFTKPFVADDGLMRRMTARIAVLDEYYSTVAETEPFDAYCFKRLVARMSARFGRMGEDGVFSPYPTQCAYANEGKTLRDAATGSFGAVEDGVFTVENREDESDPAKRLELADNLFLRVEYDGAAEPEYVSLRDACALSPDTFGLRPAKPASNAIHQTAEISFLRKTATIGLELRPNRPSRLSVEVRAGADFETIEKCAIDESALDISVAFEDADGADAGERRVALRELSVEGYSKGENIPDSEFGADGCVERPLSFEYASPLAGATVRCPSDPADPPSVVLRVRRKKLAGIGLTAMPRKTEYAERPFDPTPSTPDYAGGRVMARFDNGDALVLDLADESLVKDARAFNLCRELENGARLAQTIGVSYTVRGVTKVTSFETYVVDRKYAEFCPHPSIDASRTVTVEYGATEDAAPASTVKFHCGGAMREMERSSGDGFERGKYRVKYRNGANELSDWPKETGNYAIVHSYAGDEENNAFFDDSLILTIAKKSLAIAISDFKFVRGSTIPGNNAQALSDRPGAWALTAFENGRWAKLESLPYGESFDNVVSSVVLAACAGESSAGSGEPIEFDELVGADGETRCLVNLGVGEYGVRATISLNSESCGANYRLSERAIAETRGALEIEPREILIAAEPAWKIYGDPDPAFRFRVYDLDAAKRAFGGADDNFLSNLSGDRIISKEGEAISDEGETFAPIGNQSGVRQWVGESPYLGDGEFRPADEIDERCIVDGLGSIKLFRRLNAARELPRDVGDYPILFGSDDSSGNYSVVYAANALRIEKRRLEIECDDLTRHFGTEGFARTTNDRAGELYPYPEFRVAPGFELQYGDTFESLFGDYFGSKPYYCFRDADGAAKFADSLPSDEPLDRWSMMFKRLEFYSDPECVDPIGETFDGFELKGSRRVGKYAAVPFALPAGTYYARIDLSGIELKNYSVSNRNPSGITSGVGANALAGRDGLSVICYRGSDWDALGKGENWAGGRESEIVAYGMSDEAPVSDLQPTDLDRLEIDAGGALVKIKDKAMRVLVLAGVADGGVARIGKNAFENCNRLKFVCYQGPAQEWERMEKGENWAGGANLTVLFEGDGLKVSELEPTDPKKLKISGYLRGLRDKSLRTLVIGAGEISGIAPGALADCADLRVICYRGSDWDEIEKGENWAGGRESEITVLRPGSDLCDLVPTDEGLMTVSGILTGLADPELESVVIEKGAIAGIGANAFKSTRISKIFYKGDDWDAIEKGKNWKGGRSVSVYGPGDSFEETPVSEMDATPLDKLRIRGILVGLADESAEIVVIPQNLIAGIGTNAFARCKKLKAVLYQGDDWDSLLLCEGWKGGRAMRTLKGDELFEGTQVSEMDPTDASQFVVRGILTAFDPSLEFAVVPGNRIAGFGPRAFASCPNLKVFCYQGDNLRDLVPGDSRAAFARGVAALDRNARDMRDTATEKIDLGARFDGIADEFAPVLRQITLSSAYAFALVTKKIDATMDVGSIAMAGDSDMRDSYDSESGRELYEYLESDGFAVESADDIDRFNLFEEIDGRTRLDRRFAGKIGEIAYFDPEPIRFVDDATTPLENFPDGYYARTDRDGSFAYLPATESAPARGYAYYRKLAYRLSDSALTDRIRFGLADGGAAAPLDAGIYEAKWEWIDESAGNDFDMSISARAGDRLNERNEVVGTVSHLERMHAALKKKYKKMRDFALPGSEFRAYAIVLPEFVGMRYGQRLPDSDEFELEEVYSGKSVADFSLDICMDKGGGKPLEEYPTHPWSGIRKDAGWKGAHRFSVHEGTDKLRGADGVARFVRDLDPTEPEAFVVVEGAPAIAGAYVSDADTPLPGFPDGYFSRTGEGTAARPYAYATVAPGSAPIVGATYCRKLIGAEYLPATAGKYESDSVAPLPGFPKGYCLKDPTTGEFVPVALGASPTRGETYWKKFRGNGILVGIAEEYRGLERLVVPAGRFSGIGHDAFAGCDDLDALCYLGVDPFARVLTNDDDPAETELVAGEYSGKLEYDYFASPGRNYVYLGNNSALSSAEWAILLDSLFDPSVAESKSLKFASKYSYVAKKAGLSLRVEDAAANYSESDDFFIEIEAVIDSGEAFGSLRMGDGAALTVDYDAFALKFDVVAEYNERPESREELKGASLKPFTLFSAGKADKVVRVDSRSDGFAPRNAGVYRIKAASLGNPNYTLKDSREGAITIRALTVPVFIEPAFDDGDGDPLRITTEYKPREATENPIDNDWRLSAVNPDYAYASTMCKFVRYYRDPSDLETRLESALDFSPKTLTLAPSDGKGEHVFPQHPLYEKTPAGEIAVDARGKCSVAGYPIIPKIVGEYVNYTILFVKKAGFAPTQDETAAPGKAYYSRSGDGTALSPHVYSLVESPTDAGLGDYFETLFVPLANDAFVPTRDETAEPGKAYYSRTGDGSALSPYEYSLVESPTDADLAACFERVPLANGEKYEYAVRPKDVRIIGYAALNSRTYDGKDAEIDAKRLTFTGDFNSNRIKRDKVEFHIVRPWSSTAIGGYRNVAMFGAEESPESRGNKRDCGVLHVTATYEDEYGNMDYALLFGEDVACFVDERGEIDRAVGVYEITPATVNFDIRKLGKIPTRQFDGYGLNGSRGYAPISALSLSSDSPLDDETKASTYFRLEPRARSATEFGEYANVEPDPDWPDSRLRAPGLEDILRYDVGFYRFDLYGGHVENGEFAPYADRFAPHSGPEPEDFPNGLFERTGEGTAESPYEYAPATEPWSDETQYYFRPERFRLGWNYNFRLKDFGSGNANCGSCDGLFEIAPRDAYVAINPRESDDGLLDNAFDEYPDEKLRNALKAEYRADEEYAYYIDFDGHSFVKKARDGESGDFGVEEDLNDSSGGKFRCGFYAYDPNEKAFRNIDRMFAPDEISGLNIRRGAGEEDFDFVVESDSQIREYAQSEKLKADIDNLKSRNPNFNFVNGNVAFRIRPIQIPLRLRMGAIVDEDGAVVASETEYRSGAELWFDFRYAQGDLFFNGVKGSEANPRDPYLASLDCVKENIIYKWSGWEIWLEENAGAGWRDFRVDGNRIRNVNKGTLIKDAEGQAALTPWRATDGIVDGLSANAYVDGAYVGRYRVCGSFPAMPGGMSAKYRITIDYEDDPGAMFTIKRKELRVKCARREYFDKKSEHLIFDVETSLGAALSAAEYESAFGAEDADGRKFADYVFDRSKIDDGYEADWATSKRYATVPTALFASVDANYVLLPAEDGVDVSFDYESGKESWGEGATIGKSIDNGEFVFIPVIIEKRRVKVDLRRRADGEKPLEFGYKGTLKAGGYALSYSNLPDFAANGKYEYKHWDRIGERTVVETYDYAVATGDSGLAGFKNPVSASVESRLNELNGIVLDSGRGAHAEALDGILAPASSLDAQNYSLEWGEFAYKITPRKIRLKIWPSVSAPIEGEENMLHLLWDERSELRFAPNGAGRLDCKIEIFDPIEGVPHSGMTFSDAVRSENGTVEIRDVAYAELSDFLSVVFERLERSFKPAEAFAPGTAYWSFSGPREFATRPRDWNAVDPSSGRSSRYYVKNADGTHELASEFDASERYYALSGPCESFGSRPDDWTEAENPTDASPSDRYFAIESIWVGGIGHSSLEEAVPALFGIDFIFEEDGDGARKNAPNGEIRLRQKAASLNFELATEKNPVRVYPIPTSLGRVGGHNLMNDFVLAPDGATVGTDGALKNASVIVPINYAGAEIDRLFFDSAAPLPGDDAAKIAHSLAIRPVSPEIGPGSRFVPGDALECRLELTSSYFVENYDSRTIRMLSGPFRLFFRERGAADSADGRRRAFADRSRATLARSDELEPEDKFNAFLSAGSDFAHCDLVLRDHAGYEGRGDAYDIINMRMKLIPTDVDGAEIRITLYDGDCLIAYRANAWENSVVALYGDECFAFADPSPDELEFMNSFPGAARARFESAFPDSPEKYEIWEENLYYVKSDDGRIGPSTEFEPKKEYFLPPAEAIPSAEEWNAEADFNAPSDRFYALDSDGTHYSLATSYDQNATYYDFVPFYPMYRRSEGEWVRAEGAFDPSAEYSRYFSGEYLPVVFYRPNAFYERLDSLTYVLCHDPDFAEGKRYYEKIADSDGEFANYSRNAISSDVCRIFDGRSHSFRFYLDAPGDLRVSEAELLPNGDAAVSAVSHHFVRALIDDDAYLFDVPVDRRAFAFSGSECVARGTDMLGRSTNAGFAFKNLSVLVSQYTLQLALPLMPEKGHARRVADVMFWPDALAERSHAYITNEGAADNAFRFLDEIRGGAAFVAQNNGAEGAEAYLRMGKIKTTATAVATEPRGMKTIRIEGTYDWGDVRTTLFAHTVRVLSTANDSRRIMRQFAKIRFDGREYALDAVGIDEFRASGAGMAISVRRKNKDNGAILIKKRSAPEWSEFALESRRADFEAGRLTYSYRNVSDAADRCELDEPFGRIDGRAADEIRLSGNLASEFRSDEPASEPERSKKYVKTNALTYVFDSLAFGDGADANIKFYFALSDPSFADLTGAESADSWHSGIGLILSETEAELRVAWRNGASLYSNAETENFAPNPSAVYALKIVQTGRARDYAAALKLGADRDISISFRLYECDPATGASKLVFEHIVKNDFGSGGDGVSHDVIDSILCAGSSLGGVGAFGASLSLIDAYVGSRVNRSADFVAQGGAADGSFASRLDPLEPTGAVYMLADEYGIPLGYNGNAVNIRFRLNCPPGDDPAGGFKLYFGMNAPHMRKKGGSEKNQDRGFVLTVSRNCLNNRLAYDGQASGYFDKVSLAFFKNGKFFGDRGKLIEICDSSNMFDGEEHEITLVTGWEKNEEGKIARAHAKVFVDGNAPVSRATIVKNDTTGMPNLDGVSSQDSEPNGDSLFLRGISYTGIEPLSQGNANAKPEIFEYLAYDEQKSPA